MLTKKKLIEYNYLYSDEKYNYFKVLNVKPANHLFRDILIIIRNIGYYLISDLRLKKYFIPKGKAIFFYQTNNNYISLLGVKDKIADSIFLGINSKHVKKEYVIPKSPILILSFLFLPLLLLYLVSSKGYIKKAIKHNFYAYLESFGIYYFLKIYLRLLQPKFVVFANEHNNSPLILCDLCNKNGITTYYIPHGAGGFVNENQIMDFLLFEGKFALEKYVKCEIQKPSKIFLIGIPRFDLFIQIKNNSSRLTRLGICQNEMDPPQLVEDLLFFLLRQFPNIIITLRPHPGERSIGYYEKLAKKLNIPFSNSNNENVFDFLHSMDAIIACESSIHLEATMLNICSIYFDYTQRNLDSFDFVKNGLSKYIDNYKDLEELLVQLIAEKPVVYQQANYYNSVMGTIHEGKSTELAVNLIMHIQNGQKPDNAIWKRIENLGKVEAYELVENGSIV